MNYSAVIVVEKTDTGYSSYCPNVPGVIATGSTRAETEQLMKEALQLHLEGILENDKKITLNESYVKELELSV